MANYRKPTEKESAKLDSARKKVQEGIEGEKDIFSKMMPTMAKSARDDIKSGMKMRESVPEKAREGEAYQNAGYKTGGKVATHKKTLEKAGFYDKGKTKSDREKIVKRSTTKPERIEMFEKIFSTKRMNAGGMASKRADGCAVRGKTKA